MPFIRFRLATVAVAAALIAGSALAQKKYDPGATDKEIKLGNAIPYSGPASAYGAIGKAVAAYFDKVNAEGGVNGRMIKFLSLDDGYNPARTVEVTRRLVEEDEVLLMFQTLGTPSNGATRRIFPTPWAGNRVTSPRPRSMRRTCWRPSPAAK